MFLGASLSPLDMQFRKDKKRLQLYSIKLILINAKKESEEEFFAEGNFMHESTGSNSEMKLFRLEI